MSLHGSRGKPEVFPFWCAYVTPSLFFFSPPDCIWVAITAQTHTFAWDRSLLRVCDALCVPKCRGLEQRKHRRATYAKVNNETERQNYGVAARRLARLTRELGWVLRHMQSPSARHTRANSNAAYVCDCAVRSSLMEKTRDLNLWLAGFQFFIFLYFSNIPRNVTCGMS
jgi:hypothetical protein